MDITDSSNQVDCSDSCDDSDSSYDSSYERDKRSRKKKRFISVVGAATYLFHLRRPKRKRRSRLLRRRRCIEELLREAENDGFFRREYRMSAKSFHKLCDLLAPHIEPSNIHMARDYLPPQLVVATALRFFAGASYIDLMRRSGISRPAVYKCIWRVVHAVILNDAVGYAKFPQTEAECQSVADGWAKISGPAGAKGLFKTAIAMIDGVLIRIKAPSYRDTNKAEDYRSGHKKAYGVNACPNFQDRSVCWRVMSLLEASFQDVANGPVTNAAITLSGNCSDFSSTNNF